jgi:hypothetical protein
VVTSIFSIFIFAVRCFLMGWLSEVDYVNETAVG